MADFLPALAVVLQHEGGYVNNPNDHGGETYRGITRKNFANWPGWAVLDARQPIHHGQIFDDLEGMVADFYRRNFWHFGDLNDQAVANKLFDQSVLMDCHTAVFLFQSAIVACGTVIEIDCAFGSKTAAAANAINPERLLRTFKDELVQRAMKIVQRDPTQREFYAGWVSRIES